MKVNPRDLTAGTTLHWYNGSTATVMNLTGAAVLVRWDADGRRVLYPFDDNAWNYFRYYPHSRPTKKGTHGTTTRRKRRHHRSAGSSGA